MLKTKVGQTKNDEQRKKSQGTLMFTRWNLLITTCDLLLTTRDLNYSLLLPVLQIVRVESFLIGSVFAILREEANKVEIAIRVELLKLE